MFVYNRKVLPLPKEVLNMFREGRKFSYPQTCFMTSMFGEKCHRICKHTMHSIKLAKAIIILTTIAKHPTNILLVGV